MNVVMDFKEVTLEYPLPKKYRLKDVHPSGVREIDLEIRNGEVVGIIGRNGSGKSTLLKLMAGVFPPDSGTIATRGSVSLLAGVGVGFHKDLTGRENSYLYGALMGRTNSQIDELINDICDFSELEHHFDRPLRTYSSGMKSRLGISVATSFKPDLLLIDEVLGVGDVSFREKSKKRVRDLINNAGSVVIVSHSLSLMGELCDRIVLIDHGRIVNSGEPKKVLENYTSLMNEKASSMTE
jgi:ABC-type polysaccharide/polyol phosphate transport system ATPase subunit